MIAADSRERWALGASLLIHGTIAALVFAVHLRARQTPLPVDVWAGTSGELVGVQFESWSEPAAPESAPQALDEPASATAPASGDRGPEAEAIAAPTANDRGLAVDDAAALTRPSPKPSRGKPVAKTPEDEYGEQWIRIEDQLEPEAVSEPAAAAPPTVPSKALADAIFSFAPKRPESPPPTSREPVETAAVAPSPAEPPSPEFEPPVHPVVPPEERSVRASAGLGGMDAPDGRRVLGRAFARAIPAANTKDPVWNRLPLGPAGETTIRLAVLADGSLAPVEHSRNTPPHLERLVDRTLLALMGGRFALPDRREQTLTLRLQLRISQRPPSSGPLELGFEPPGFDRPGRAYFQLPSGRFVEVDITEIGRPSPGRRMP